MTAGIESKQEAKSMDFASCCENDGGDRFFAVYYQRDRTFRLGEVKATIQATTTTRTPMP